MSVCMCVYVCVCVCVCDMCMCAHVCVCDVCVSYVCVCVCVCRLNVLAVTYSDNTSAVSSENQNAAGVSSFKYLTRSVHLSAYQSVS